MKKINKILATLIIIIMTMFAFNYTVFSENDSEMNYEHFDYGNNGGGYSGEGGDGTGYQDLGDLENSENKYCSDEGAAMDGGDYVTVGGVDISADSYNPTAQALYNVLSQGGGYSSSTQQAYWNMINAAGGVMNLMNEAGWGNDTGGSGGSERSFWCKWKYLDGRFNR